MLVLVLMLLVLMLLLLVLLISMVMASLPPRDPFHGPRCEYHSKRGHCTGPATGHRCRELPNVCIRGNHGGVKITNQEKSLLNRPSRTP